MLSDFHKPKAKYRAFKSYWQSYGGLPALLDSQWLAFSLILTAALFPLWSETQGLEYEWLSIMFSTIPALLGFSIGSVSILLAFSSGPKNALHKVRGNASYYLKLMASFFHFILLQFLTIGLGLALSAYSNLFLSGFAFFIFLYALFSGVAAASIIYSMAEIYDKAERMKEQKTDK